MGVITNGAGGGNVRYNPVNDMVEIKYNGTWTPWKSGNMQTAYLYRNGESVVQWDNTGYNQDSGYTTDGGANFNSTNITFPSISTDNHNRVAVTQAPVDLTDYSNIVVLYNGVEYRADISGVSGSAYIWLNASRNASKYFLFFGASSQKADFFTYLIGSSYTMIVSASPSVTDITTKATTEIWLE